MRYVAALLVLVAAVAVGALGVVEEGPQGADAPPPAAVQPGRPPAAGAAPDPPPPVAPPLPGALPPVPTVTDAFSGWTTVWTRGSLPLAGLEVLRADPAVADLVVARTGGLAVASGVPGFPEVPVEAVAVDPEPFAAAAGLPSLAAGLRDGAVLSETSAGLRGLGAGDVLTLVDGTAVPVSAVVPDARVGGYEVATSTGRGASLGVTGGGYALVLPADGTGADEVDAAVRRVLGGPVRVTEPGRLPFARRADEVLPQGSLKALLGEFALRRTPGGLVQDPAWREENIRTQDVPLIGRVTCHRRVLDALVPALQRLADAGLGDLVDPDQVGGCLAVRDVRGGSSLSRHAWGGAVDLNVAENPLGAQPDISAELVARLEAAGLRWGGRFLRPDGQHFEAYGVAPDRVTPPG